VCKKEVDMNRLITYLLLLAFFAAALSGCGSAEPRQIASYPVQIDKESPAYQPGSTQFVYAAYIEMEVSDPSSAAKKAANLAATYDGYLVSSHTYHWDNLDQVTVVLAVPASNFEKMHTALLRLGKLTSERVSGEWEDGGWNAYSEVTVNFSPSALAWPSLPNGWNPERTLRQAFNVFLTIFGFLADIVIWLLVVVGPFALLGLAAWAVVRRLRRTARR
jgi:hypothetical protein